MEATKPPAERVLALVVLLAGCRAQPAAQGDAARLDLAVDDGAADLASAPDAAPDLAYDAACPPGPVEICGNGCDDDRNGYTDDDDPACTPQVVATFDTGSPGLERMLLTPQPFVRLLDDNPLGAGAHGVYSHAFAPGVAFVALDGASRQVLRIVLGGGPTGVSVYQPSYYTRDVCVFNGELIVVEPAGRLHRLSADGHTELGQVDVPSAAPGSMVLAACATDGQVLYVAEHTATGPTVFEVLAPGFAVAAPRRNVPDLLSAQGLVRCLDFAWTRFGFYGLFSSQLGATDLAPTELVVPFLFDGGVGAPLDAGNLRGVGEFLPSP
jgi:hypothetical protein